MIFVSKSMDDFVRLSATEICCLTKWSNMPSSIMWLKSDQSGDYYKMNVGDGNQSEDGRGDLMYNSEPHFVRTEKKLWMRVRNGILWGFYDPIRNNMLMDREKRRQLPLWDELLQVCAPVVFTRRTHVFFIPKQSFD